MASLYVFPDHSIAAFARQLAQDQKRRIISAITRIKAGRKQQLENVLWEIYEQLDLSQAVGAQLDRLGAIVGEPRNGRSDSRYRLWIRARARVNRSAGRPDDSLQVARLLIESDATVEYVDIPDRDAEMEIRISGSSLDMTEIAAILDAVRPAGVGSSVITDVGANAFRFDAGPGWDVGLWADIY
ncbi:MAG: hypothetical protein RL701_5993 [Pseudomonadota bacterium]|jgi:hypothetical protein